MSDLVGCWRLVTADERLGLQGIDEMEFRDDGYLVYAFSGPEKWQLAVLTYRVEGDEIITDQPSAPKHERTRFKLDSSGQLVLAYLGGEARFERIQYLSVDAQQIAGPAP